MVLNFCFHFCSVPILLPKFSVLYRVDFLKLPLCLKLSSNTNPTIPSPPPPLPHHHLSQYFNMCVNVYSKHTHIKTYLKNTLKNVYIPDSIPCP